MKKSILVAVTVAVLAGCGERPQLETKKDKKFTTVNAVVNKKEREMINYWLADADASNYLYNPLWTALATRNKYGTNAVRRSDDEIPFCDVIASLVEAEDDIRSTYERTMSNQWRTQYGISLSEQCNYDAPESLEEKAQRVEKLEMQAELNQREQNALSGNINNMDDVQDATIELLDPHEYDYLIESARDCNRAKTKLLELTQAGKPLTQADGSEARKLIIECKMHKLEVELNK
ncbi:hypothetical protein phiST2_0128 [Vibrio phage phi-ST2]|nr:hypothetical protein phiST2_0128 [Vibrio phage phi-ST2]